ncbi:NUC189-domain-containing protein [Paxillus ammoniavirescens]|nr:NUC189-domain-containing protein [Paxillus ammoniavirescens]
MDSAPKPKKSRTKSSTRKNKPEIHRATVDEVLIDNEPAVVTAPKTARYGESSSLAIRSGLELGQDQAMEDLAAREVDGTLDADLAELSLGQRLTALNSTDAANKGSESDNDEEAPSKLEKQQGSPNIVPAHSLTRTLIQALHSSDSRLLETCLAHSETTLIRNTVTRLPPQLAIPLLLACVERLGRGARAANMKGGGGGASSQRGTVLITWVKTTLTVHSGHLMTVPDLVARLAGLHATLTSRLALQDSLLSLTGKLDMVLSQIEMRSSSAPAPLTSKKDNTTRPNSVRQPARYTEGESEDEEDQMNAEPPAESGDEQGSVEDIELGGESGGDDEDEEDDDEDIEEDDDEEDDDDSDAALNGFIDDKAEEFDDDEEDDESE